MEVNEVRRDSILVAAIFLLVAILTTPIAVAKPTSAENNPNSASFMWHSENGASTPVEVMTNPPWAEEGDIIVTHTKATWALNPVFNNYVQIGDDNQIPIDAETGYEGTLYVQNVASSPTTSALNYRVYETIMWGDGNYIDIMCNERANLELLLDSEGNVIGYDFYASGTFSGNGMIDGQKVQVTGIREGFVDPMIGFVLECYGTIRFAGNA